MSIDEKLIKNLENQVERVLNQLRDIEEAKDDLTEEEYTSMREETVDQIKEFTESLNRMNKGDLTINSKFTTMRSQIRNAISSSFNTLEMIKLFGEQSANELGQQLLLIDQEFRLKKITQKQMEKRKSEVLSKLQQQGHPLSESDKKFLDLKLQRELDQLQDVSPD